MSQKPARDKGERRYTSLACLNCRKRKVKCNNEEPRCSNCKLYDNECVYGQDRRRASTSIIPPAGQRVSGSAQPPTTRPDPNQNLASAGLDFDTFDSTLLPSLDDGNQSLLDGPFSSNENDWTYWANPNDNMHLFSNTGFDPNQTFPTFNTPGSFQNNTYLNAFRVGSDTSETSPPSQGLSPSIFTRGAALPNESAPELDEAVKTSRSRSQDDDTLGDVTKQLTSRLGRLQIAEDGRPRYYGAMSNMHLLHSGPGSLTQPNIRHVLTHGENAIAAAGLVWDVDPAYEVHLINLFFAWHNNLQFPVDKDIFLRERDRFRQGQVTDLYTPSLENAILCIGSAYTDRSHPNIQGSVDEFFALRAKAYIDIEMDSPSIATAQTMLIMSSHEAAHTRESRGWIYMGMAVQIITDLGLHLDLEDEYSRLEGDDRADMNIMRRNVFWTVKSIDTLWSAYSGRPSAMKNMVSNQKGPLPSRTYKWEYYLDEHSKLSFPADFDFRAAAYVHVHLASLTLILARVGEVLYSGVPDISSDIKAFVALADSDFQHWLLTLPPNMHVDLSQPFHTQGVLELHLIYHESIILLHRPLITPVESTAALGVTSDHQTAAVSLGRCIESADQICAIMVHYRNRYGLKRLHHQMVHAAMTAALIHAYQLCTTANGSEENRMAQASFLTCVQALGEMGQTFKSASRALDVVTSLRQSWRDDATAGDRFKRARLR